MSVIRLMNSTHESEQSATRPDEECFRYVLRTAAGRPELYDIGTLVDEVMLLMRERFLLPDGESYGCSIRTWRNCVIHPDYHDDGSMAAHRALDLLSDMLLARGRSSTVSVKVRTSNVNDVLQILSVSRLYRRVENAESLLEHMEKANDDSPYPKPNANSYRFMFDVYRNSQAKDRISRASHVLDKMIVHFTEPTTCSKHKGRITSAFNSYVQVCASAKVGDDNEGIRILGMVLEGVERMRHLKEFAPNAQTYSSILGCCGNLLPPSSQRGLFMERIFAFCCQDGMVDENVLTQLRTLGTSDQYARLVIAHSTTIEGTKVVPEQWTINALGTRVVTEDGRRATPLSIDGRLKVTRAMQEFKMRRLRDKRNRKLLEGGRRPRVEAVL
jgi:hypothetical protein